MANGFGVLRAIRGLFKAHTLSPPPVRASGAGWYGPVIREPYAGAWQRNEEWRMDDVTAHHAVFACVTLIANDIGKLKPLVMRDKASGISEPVNLSQYAVLKRPNRYQNHIQFKQWWMISKLLRGNTYALKMRDGSGVVRTLYVIDPTKAQPLIAEDGSVFYHLMTDTLVPMDGTDVSEELQTLAVSGVTVPASEIIHDRMNCLFHPLVGISPLYASGQAAQLGLNIQTDSAKFFRNGASPGGILTAPGPISIQTAERLKQHWEENYTGVNSGRIAVLGDGLKYEQLRMTNVDAQTIQQLDWSARVVCSAFHVPAYKIGVGNLPTHDNIEALTQDYYSNCLQELIESWELCMDEGLQMPEGTRTQLDLDGLFRMDSSRQIENLTKGIRGTLYAPNEGRRKLNLPPLEGGDTVYLQQQNYSLSALARRDATDDPFAKSQTPPPAPDDSAKSADDIDPAESPELATFIESLNRTTCDEFKRSQDTSRIIAARV